MSKPASTISIETLFSLLMAILGGGLVLTWLSLWTNTASAFSFTSNATQTFHASVITFGILGAAVRLLSAIQGNRLNLAANNEKAVLISSAIAAVSLPVVVISFLIEASSAAMMLRLFGLGCAVVFGVVFLITCWVNVISRYEEEFMMPVIAASFLLFSLLYFALLAAPSTALVFIASPLPLLAGACFVLAKIELQEKSQSESPIIRPTRKEWMLLVLLALSTFFFGLIGQIVRGLTWSETVGVYSASSSIYHEMGILISSMALLIYVVATHARGWQRKNQIPGLVCLFVVALGIIVPGVLHEGYMPIADFALGIGLGCFQIQIFYYSALLSKLTEKSPFTLFGLLYAPLELAGAMGLLAMDAFMASSIAWSQLALVAVVALFLLIFVALLPFLKHQNDILHPPVSTEACGNPSSKTKASVDTLMERFGLFGFTPREEEVAILLLQGRSVPFIQDELSISEGTAKTHLLHIYRKCGVHNRQEFLNLFQ